MAYIDEEYYRSEFGGSPIPSEDFPRLAQIASDLLDAIAVLPIENITDNIRRACAYQLEFLSMQGGVEAVTGFAAALSGTERLGDYSVTSLSAGTGTTSSANAIAVNGIPFSALAVELLRKEGLMSRWAYAGRVCHGHPW